jgi:hypothetical protein
MVLKKTGEEYGDLKTKQTFKTVGELQQHREKSKKEEK